MKSAVTVNSQILWNNDKSPMRRFWHNGVVFVKRDVPNLQRMHLNRVFFHTQTLFLGVVCGMMKKMEVAELKNEEQLKLRSFLHVSIYGFQK